MNPHHASVALRAGHRCEYCKAPEAAFNLPFEVEHITPLVRKGITIEGNLALSCRSCNLHKAAHISGVDPTSQAIVPLFDPRNDNWAEHFVSSIATGEIAGLTAVGRATVAQLRMNSDAQLTARRKWARLGLFP